LAGTARTAPLPALRRFVVEFRREGMIASSSSVAVRSGGEGAHLLRSMTRPELRSGEAAKKSASVSCRGLRGVKMLFFDIFDFNSRAVRIIS